MRVIQKVFIKARIYFDNHRKQIVIKNILVSVMLFVFSMSALANDSGEIEKKLNTYVKSKLFNDRLREAAIINDAYLGFSCPSNYTISLLTIVKQKNPALIINEAVHTHPLSGIWRARYEVIRCGKKNIFNAIFGGNKTTSPYMRISVPGSTKANSELARAIRPYVTKTAMQLADFKKCQNQRLINTEVQLEQNDIEWAKMKWKRLTNEIWTIDLCGRLVKIKLGHGSNATNPNKLFLVKKYDKPNWVPSGRILVGSNDSLAIQNTFYEIASGNTTALMEYLWAAANEEIPHAQTVLSLLFKNGIIVDKDMDRAAFWAFRAAYNNYAPAMKLIATIYNKGLWISKDQRLASAWLKRAQKFKTNKKSNYNIN